MSYGDWLLLIASIVALTSALITIVPVKENGVLVRVFQMISNIWTLNLYAPAKKKPDFRDLWRDPHGLPGLRTPVWGATEEPEEEPEEKPKEEGLLPALTWLLNAKDDPIGVTGAYNPSLGATYYNDPMIRRGNRKFLTKDDIDAMRESLLRKSLSGGAKSSRPRPPRGQGSRRPSSKLEKRVIAKFLKRMESESGGPR